MFSAGIINSGGPNLSGGGGGGAGGGGGLWWWWVAAVPHSRTAVAVTAVAGIAVFAALYYTTNRGNLKSPWSQWKRKGVLSPQDWRSLFTPEGRLLDGGIKFLKKVRSGGIDPSIRAEVWPFLLGVYDLSSTKEEREVIRTQKRKEYEKLRKKCEWLYKHSEGSNLYDLNGATNDDDDDDGRLVQDVDSSEHKDAISARDSSTNDKRAPDVEYSDDSSSTLVDGVKGSRQVSDNVDSALNSPPSDVDSLDHPEVIQASSTSEGRDENDHDVQSQASLPPLSTVSPVKCSSENFATWQRIIHVDAVRANAEWMPFSPSQAAVTESQAQRLAEAVGLKVYDHLEPSRIFHAARLVAILETYAVYDPEIGYCQGMSDLLSPIITFITEDYEAFWCFVGFMKKARHNFRLDEVGIRRQLNIVSKIIKFKDSCLYGHLEKLQAEDCFFVYRMVVVLFRRELTFEQTVCLWEVIWADQAAIRASIGKSAWSTIRQRAPPTDDLLLYAIAASVLQRRKTIIEKYSSMDEILRECNSMAGHLDVWKLLDDAHSLVVNLHDKIETSLQ